MWDESKCDYCGICLTKCQFVEYGQEKAVQEIAALIDGEDAEILRACINCIGCNEYCPKGAGPWDLIADLQYKKGLASPLLSEKVKKTHQRNLSAPNIVTPGDPDKPILSLRTSANFYKIGGRMFEGLGTVVGGDYYPVSAAKSGMGHPSLEMVQTFVGNLAKLGAKEIVFVQPGDFAYLIRSKDYGVELPFRPIHIFEYLYDYLNDHQSDITRLGRKIAYQRSCWSRLVPDDQEAFLDKIFDLIGVERVARRYDRKNALCCGKKVAKNLEMNLNDAMESGAEAMVMICPACWKTMAEACQGLGMPPILVHDLCRVALGERPFPS